MAVPADPARRRSWLFVPGADERAHERAARSGADVLIHGLEDMVADLGAARSRGGEELAYARARFLVLGG